MRILIDAMGGDHAPEAIVRGAIDAAAEFGVQIVLVGRGEAILKSLSALGLDTLPKGVEIANAEDVVEMTDDPANVVRTRPGVLHGGGSENALRGRRRCLYLCRQHRCAPERRHAGGQAGQGDPPRGALPGDTHENRLNPAHRLRRQRLSVRRSFSPSSPCWDPSYAQRVQGKAQPKVALLNIGTEEGKGTQLQKDTFAMLQKAQDMGILQFVGNMEARDVMSRPGGRAGGRRLLRQCPSQDH